MHTYADQSKAQQQQTSSTAAAMDRTRGAGHDREMDAFPNGAVRHGGGHAASAPIVPARNGIGAAGLHLGAGGQMRERPRSSGLVSARTVLRPHEGSPDTLRREAHIYAQGKTPVRIGGSVVAWDSRPLGATATGDHLRQIQQQFGPRGVAKSVHGLAQTRGEEFAHSAARHAGVEHGASRREGDAIGAEAAGAIRASQPSGGLPGDLREKLTQSGGHDFAGISIYNDASAHRAAAHLNARAFTVGSGIYFGRNEYQPTTTAGQHLLAHEAAHTVQQRGQTSVPNQHFRTTAPADREEDEASHFADSVASPGAATPQRLTPSTRTGLVSRAISFTHANDTMTSNPVAAHEAAGGFNLTSGPNIAFQWATDVTIHGVAGDPFGNFEVGFLQVEREFYVNVYWGTGADRTHRTVRPDHLPRRDAASQASVFAMDGMPYLAPAFAADGDVRSPAFQDTPGTATIPWANPVAGRGGTRGWFNYGDAFVTYLSARDTTAGTGAAAFRDLACVYWNQSIGGHFDNTRPLGTRITITEPGVVNHGGIIRGGSREFPAIHGGTIANGNDTTTDT